MRDDALDILEQNKYFTKQMFLSVRSMAAATKLLLETHGNLAISSDWCGFNRKMCPWRSKRVFIQHILSFFTQKI